MLNLLVAAGVSRVVAYIMVTVHGQRVCCFLVYFTTLSVHPDYKLLRVGWLVNWRGCAKKPCGIMNLDRLRKSTKNFEIESVLAEIQTTPLPNTNLDSHLYTNLPGVWD
jgi:hypothetical protein